MIDSYQVSNGSWRWGRATIVSFGFLNIAVRKEERLRIGATAITWVMILLGDLAKIWLDIST